MMTLTNSHGGFHNWIMYEVRISSKTKKTLFWWCRSSCLPKLPRWVDIKIHSGFIHVRVIG